MKIHHSQIPEEGIRKKIVLPVAELKRLTEIYSPQKGKLEADIFLKRRMWCATLEGSLVITVSLPCQRCLEPVEITLEESFRETLEPQSRLDQQGVDIPLSPGDLEVSFIEGEVIDLVALLEDQALLMIPASVCEEDENGRCIECGKIVAEMFNSNSEEHGEHLFAQMKKILT